MIVMSSQIRNAGRDFSTTATRAPLDLVGPIVGLVAGITAFALLLTLPLGAWALGGATPVVLAVGAGAAVATLVQRLRRRITLTCGQDAVTVDEGGKSRTLSFDDANRFLFGVAGDAHFAVAVRRRAALVRELPRARIGELLPVVEAAAALLEQTGEAAWELSASGMKHGASGPEIAVELARAATSVPLNISEGSYSRGNRNARYHTAMGSVAETHAILELAESVGWIARDPARHAKPNRIVGALVRVLRLA